MVDSALLKQVMRLDESARRELRDVIDDSLPEATSPQLLTLLRERIADANENPDDYITLDEYKRQAAQRRAQRTA